MHSFSKKLAMFGASVILAASFSTITVASAQDKFERFTVSDPENTQAVDYTPLDKFYAQVSQTKRGRIQFRYDALEQSGTGALDAFIATLGRIPPSRLSEKEQLAYWLNLRNILVIRAIAGDNPKSLKRGRGSLSNPGELWTRKRITVEDVNLSIDEIERNIILANWGDNPDIIYGLYQGVEGGPSFTPAVNYTGATAPETLKERGAAFINGRNVVRVKKGKANIPGIFEWYQQGVFGGDEASLLAHIAAHADGDLASDLASASGVSFKKVDYGIDRVEIRQQRQFNSGGFSGGGGGSYGGGGGGGGS